MCTRRLFGLVAMNSFCLPEDEIGDITQKIVIQWRTFCLVNFALGGYFWVVRREGCRKYARQGVGGEEKVLRTFWSLRSGCEACVRRGLGGELRVFCIFWSPGRGVGAFLRRCLCGETKVFQTFWSRWGDHRKLSRGSVSGRMRFFDFLVI